MPVFCVVVARWNSFVVDSLEAGAIDTLKRHGTPEDNITIVRLPVPSRCHWCWTRSPPRASTMRSSRWVR